jgi:hypothetical protein
MLTRAYHYAINLPRGGRNVSKSFHGRLDGTGCPDAFLGRRRVKSVAA